MPKYVMLFNLTDQGIKSVKESPQRVRRAMDAIKQQGGRLVDFSLTLGQYDMVATFEAPDNATMARFVLTLGSQGNVRTTTLSALSLEEFEKLTQSLG